MRPGRGTAIIVVGVVLGLILGGLGLWAMSRGDGAVSRPVAAVEPVAPVEADGQTSTPEAAANPRQKPRR